MGIANQMSAFAQPMSGIMASLQKTQEMIDRVVRTPEIIAAANALTAFNERLNGILAPLRTPEWLEQANAIQARINEAVSPSIMAMSNWLTDHRQEIVAVNQALTAGIAQYAQIANAVSAQLPRIVEFLQTPSPLTDWIRDFDMSSVRFNGDCLVYDGIEYTQEELAVELEQEIYAYEQGNELKDRVVEFKSKLWLLFLVISLIWSLPEAQERAEWFAENVQKIVEMFEQNDVAVEVFAYTISESVPLRDAPSGDGKILKRLPIETVLRVLSDKPRWFEIEYTADDDTVIIGWVSKRSVEVGK